MLSHWAGIFRTRRYCAWSERILQPSKQRWQRTEGGNWNGLYASYLNQMMEFTSNEPSHVTRWPMMNPHMTNRSAIYTPPLIKRYKLTGSLALHYMPVTLRYHKKQSRFTPVINGQKLLLNWPVKSTLACKNYTMCLEAQVTGTDNHLDNNWRGKGPIKLWYCPEGNKRTTKENGKMFKATAKSRVEYTLCNIVRYAEMQP